MDCWGSGETTAVRQAGEGTIIEQGRSDLSTRLSQHVLGPQRHCFRYWFRIASLASVPPSWSSQGTLCGHHLLSISPACSGLLKARLLSWHRSPVARSGTKTGTECQERSCSSGHFLDGGPCPQSGLEEQPQPAGSQTLLQRRVPCFLLDRQYWLQVVSGVSKKPTESGFHLRPGGLNPQLPRRVAGCN